MPFALLRICGEHGGVPFLAPSGGFLEGSALRSEEYGT